MSCSLKLLVKKGGFSTSDSKPESTLEDSSLKSSKSTFIDFGVESFSKYSKLELVLADSKLEFIVELEFSFLSVEF
jgi:hypothetical protein